MKRTIMFLAVLATAITLNAQRVALHSSSGVQHFWGPTGLVSAYDAANAGDTVYLPGGAFSTPANFEKTLLIFGAGHYVDSALVTGITSINGNIILRENADGFYLEGVQVTGKISFFNNESINDVVIKRCKVNSSVEVLGNLINPSQNIALIGNVLLGSITLSNAQVVLVSNNIIQLGIESTYGNIINNNIFITRISGHPYENFRGNNNNLANNIFMMCFDYGILGSNYSGNDFRNNLITCSTPNYGAASTVINSYININQASIFVDQSGNAFSYEHDYHLQNPEIYLGTDGTEVGIYGGSFPYKEGAVPCNPHFQLKNIAPTTDVNGELNIQIQVEAQDY